MRGGRRRRVIRAVCGKGSDIPLKATTDEIWKAMREILEPDVRLHHFVSKSYLEPWADARGHLTIQRFEAGGFVSEFKKKPECMFRIRAHNDMSAASSLSPVPADLLETGVLAKGMELGFLNTRRATLDVNIRPDLGQAEFFAMCALSFYYRSPYFQRMVDAALQGEKHHLTKHHGVRTLQLILQSPSTVKHCLFHFIKAAPEARFWTSDTPSWMWHSTSSGWSPTRNLQELALIIERGETATRWIWPITPEWLLEVCPLNEPTQHVHFSPATAGRVAEYNECITSVAHQFRIRPLVTVPPEAQSAGGRKNGPGGRRPGPEG